MNVQVLSGPKASISGTLGSLFATQLSQLHTNVELTFDESRDPRSLEVKTSGTSDSSGRSSPLSWEIRFTSSETFRISQVSHNAVLNADLTSVSLLRAGQAKLQPEISSGIDVQVVVPDGKHREAIAVQQAWRALTQEQKRGLQIKWTSTQRTGYFGNSFKLRVEHLADRLRSGRRRDENPDTGVTVIGGFDPLTRLDLSIKSLSLGRPVVLLQPSSKVESIWGHPIGVIPCEASAESIAYSILQCLHDTPPCEDLIAAGHLLGSKMDQVNPEDLTRDLALAFSQGGLASTHTCRACDALVRWQPTMKAMTRDTLRFSLAAHWGIEINEETQGEPGILQRFDCGLCGSSTFNAPQGTASFYTVCHSTPQYQREDMWDYVEIADEIMRTGAREVLDFGSGIPKLLDLLPPESVNLSLLEIDSDILDQSALIGRGVQILTDWDDEKLAGTLDAVAMCHVLEHLDTPDRVLRSIYAALKPGGLLGITVPDAAWATGQFSALDWPPHHVTSFSRHGLFEMAHRAGFVRSRLIRPPGATDSSFDMLLISYKPERARDFG